MDAQPYVFAREPFPYQREEFEASRTAVARAIFWEQGLGKSKLTVDQACSLWLAGEIDAVIVIAPNGVHLNWVQEEIPAHAPPAVMAQIKALAFSSEKAGTKRHQREVEALLGHRGFAWLAISYEAFMTKNGKDAAIELFSRRRAVLAVLDEGHYIKSHTSKRTESILKMAKFCAYRRVLTGTPISVGPFDVFPCAEFLSPGFWASQGFLTFVEFKKHFGLFRKQYNPRARVWDEEKGRWVVGGKVDVLAGYRRLDQLERMLKPIASRLTKEDSGLNLPPKSYAKARFDMTPQQAELYAQMRDDAIAWINGGGPQLEAEQLGLAGMCGCPSCGGTGEVNSDGFIYPCPECNAGGTDMAPEGTPVIAVLAMTRLLRLQQITCGYLPNPDDPENPVYVIPGENRRLQLACDLVEERVKAGRKVIIWARFTLDVDLILEELKKRHISAVRYDGQADDDARAEAKARFKGVRPIMDGSTYMGQEPVPIDKQAMVWVGNPAAGATGLTLTIAKTVIYYSNSFKLIDRLQSEDRAHRIGQADPVEYIDIMADGTVDDKIIDSHREKHSIASQILGDRLKEWI